MPQPFQPQRGTTLFWTLGSIIVLSSLCTAISSLTPSATESELAANRHSQAYYAAFSGLCFAKNMTAARLQAMHDGTLACNYILGDQSFTLIVGSKNADGTYPVAVLGTSQAGKSIIANYNIPVQNITPATAITGVTAALTSGSAVIAEQGVIVNGPIQARTINLKDGVIVHGDVASQTSVILESLSLVSGSVCTGSGDVTIKTSAGVNGNVNVNGDLTLEAAAWIYGDASVTGSVTLKLLSNIYGKAHVTTGRAGVANYGGTIWGGVDVLTTPVYCNTAATPSPDRTTGTYPALNLESDQTATLASGTHTYSTITIKNGATLYLDLSSGQPLTIKTTGDVNLEDGARLRIKTRTSGSYKSVLDLSLAGNTADAALVYLKSEGIVTLKRAETFYGTIYARVGLNFEQLVALVGAYASPGTVSVKKGVVLLDYVPADQAW